MNYLSRVLGTFFSKDRKEQVVKVNRLGDKDVQEADQVAPHGIDSNPIKDMIAIYADTLSKEDKIIIGYISKNMLAEPGELRLFSTDQTGSEQNYVWIKNDGIIEIGGDADHMVRYSKLEEAFNNLKSDFNTLVSTFNGHVHSGGTIGGSTGTTATPGTPTAANIAPAKISKIKTA